MAQGIVKIIDGPHASGRGYPGMGGIGGISSGGVDYVDIGLYETVVRQRDNLLEAAMTGERAMDFELRHGEGVIGNEEWQANINALRAAIAACEPNAD